MSILNRLYKKFLKEELKRFIDPRSLMWRFEQDKVREVKVTIIMLEDGEYLRSKGTLMAVQSPLAEFAYFAEDYVNSCQFIPLRQAEYSTNWWVIKHE